MSLDEISSIVPFGDINEELESRKRSEAEKERDLPVIASLYVRGFPIAKIQEHINKQYPEDRQVSANLVKHDIRLIRKMWLESSLVDFNHMKAKELARLDEVEKELWDAWERSKANFVSTEETEHQGQVPLRAGIVVDITDRTTKRKEEERLGDLTIMQTIIKVIDMRCKLLGLMEAQRYIVDWRTEARAVGWSEKQVDNMYETVVDRFMEAIRRAQTDDSPIDATFQVENPERLAGEEENPYQEGSDYEK